MDVSRCRSRPAARPAGHGEVLHRHRRAIAAKSAACCTRATFPAKMRVVVARLRAAGALILGTTNCPEFLMAYETANLLHGATHNPWDLDRSPGGSSGGESAAIAAGHVRCGPGQRQRRLGPRARALHRHLLAQADAGPRSRASAICRPASGRSATLGAIGPMARTIGDVALLFRTLSGQDPHDPVSPPVPLRDRSLDELRAHTIGFFEDDGLVPVTPETRAAVNAAAAGAARCRLPRGAVPPPHPGTAAQAVVDILRAVRRHVLRAGDSRQARPAEPDLPGISRNRRGVRTAHRNRTAERVGRIRPAPRQNARGDERLPGPAVPGGQHPGLPPRRANLDHRRPACCLS